MDDKAWIAVMSVAFLTIQALVGIFNKRHTKEITDRMDDKFEKMLEKSDRNMKEMIQEIQNKRGSYAEAVQCMVTSLQELLIKINQMSASQHEISDNLLKLGILAKNTSRIQDKLEQRLETHSRECEQRNATLTRQAELALKDATDKLEDCMGC